MNKELLFQSIRILDSQKKWDALFEIHNREIRERTNGAPTDWA